MMSHAIEQFATQFSYSPKIIGRKIKKTYKQYVLLGMGGSHLAGDIALTIIPELPLTIWNDYGLPAHIFASKKDTLIIASSYSGNTEEVLDGFEKARRAKYPLVVIAVGGALIERAKKFSVPYIEIPNTGIQPRSALGYSLLALLEILRKDTLLRQAKQLARTLQPKTYEKIGKKLAESLKDRIPVVYSSRQNTAIAYNWKIKLNETGKIPAFYNIIPELNHNEMTGFDVRLSSKHLSKQIAFIFLRDPHDHPRILKRMDILTKLYRDRGISVHIEALSGNPLMKVFTSLLIADWTAVSLANTYNLESEQVPMVEEFKRLMTL